MRILEVKDYPSIPRLVVRVVLNEREPKWVHPSGAPGTPDTPSPAGHTGDTAESANACKTCRLNWKVQEFVFTGDELNLALNKWGNPTHAGEPAVSKRKATLDEIYAEVDRRLGGRAEFGNARREAPPALIPEAELDFEVQLAGEPRNNEGAWEQRVAVLRRGVPTLMYVIALTKETPTGRIFASPADVEADKAKVLADATVKILAQEAALAEAKAVAGS